MEYGEQRWCQVTGRSSCSYHPQEGSRTICDNYRGIALLSIPSKIFSRAIFLHENQCGFRQGRGCTDQLFSPWVLMEKAREFHKPIYICFIDLRKAYDSVSCISLWTVLQRSYSIPTKLISIIRALHEHSVAAIRCYGKTSDEFAFTSGVCQDCVLAPTLFNLYFDVAIRMALENDQPKDSNVRVAYIHSAKLVGNRRKLQHEAIISDLEYTDDMTLVAESWDDLKSMLDDVSIRCRDLGLTISCSKTKPLAVLPSDVYPKPMLINLFPDDDSVEVVSNFQYLGSIVQDNCGTAIEVDSRICKASKAFSSLCHVLWYQRKIKTRTKLRIFNVVVLPTLLYGLKSLVLHQPQLHHLQDFVMRSLRIILGVSIREKKRHTTIRRMAKQQKLSSVLSQRRLRFLGHISQMKDSRLPKQLLV